MAMTNGDKKDVEHSIPIQWKRKVPELLHFQFEQLMDYLGSIPNLVPQNCPRCHSPEFRQHHSVKRLYKCNNCCRSFTPWTYTPFANCRRHDLWAKYVHARVDGLTFRDIGKHFSLSSDACKYRELIVISLLKERWPELCDWWLQMAGIRINSPPVLRTTPFSNKEEAWEHHNHEYVQCLERGKMYSFLGTHLHKTHHMSARQYREKWQIMQKIPLAGLANRRAHSLAIKEKIINGDIVPLEQVAMMLETNRRVKRNQPFNPNYILQEYENDLKSKRLWELSPAIKCIDQSIQQQAAIRMKLRGISGESVQSIAEAFGVSKQTIYVWVRRWKTAIPPFDLLETDGYP
ncbi:helix-turn-helix protein [Raoultella ornithinolytica]|uniref:Helix-turn-helix protein n=1 Tax=Raoultella ornithinolytica TaxID=54291 RepID=A0ABD7QC09_RAOOR|nr:helix-turn-helix protein [Raoultella ornithinolytica]